MRILKHEGKQVKEEFLQRIQSMVKAGKADSEDAALIAEWSNLKHFNWFADKTVDQILEWLPDNLLSDLDALKAKQSFQKASGVPSEPNLEDALNWTESYIVGRSEKQAEYGKSIAQRHLSAIALAWKQGKTVPADASWWIENQHNIIVNLPL